MELFFFLRMRDNSHRGFSLTELAIVIAIIGVVVSGIWTYAGQTYETTRRQQLSEEMQTVVNNIHALYMGQAGIGAGGDAISVVTPSVIQQNAIPSTMVRPVAPSCTNGSSLCADNPWGSSGNIANGTFGVCAWTKPPTKAPAGSFCVAGATTVQFFAIELSGISQATCINIAPQDSGPGGPIGLQDVLINGASVLLAGNSLPVPVAFATANCAAVNKIDFVYRLQAPSL